MNRAIAHVEATPLFVEQADGYELVIPKTRHGLEPLHAIYARSALQVIERQLINQQWHFNGRVGSLIGDGALKAKTILGHVRGVLFTPHWDGSSNRLDLRW